MKQKLLLLFAGATLFLTSCAPLDKALEGQLLKFSHVKEESDYQQYAQLLEQGKLDEDGRFTAESSTESPPEGSVYVTFGRNAYLDASYYSDENLTHLLSEEGCFLFPGDSIYAGEAIIKNPNSNLYTLKNYRVTVFYETGLSEEITVSKDGTNPLVFTIPEDFTGTGLSIYPIGFYQDRTLDLSVYCMDEETRISLASAGQWYINDTACSGNSASISATEAYTLRLDYDTEEYFFVSSTPQCFTQNPNADGRVEFWEAASTDEDCLYEVELHHYLSLTLQCDDAATITVNDEEPVKLSKNKSFTRDDLKFGDILIIDTTGTCSIKEGDYRYVAASKDPLTNGNRYRLTIVSQPQDAAAEELTKVMPVQQFFGQQPIRVQ